MHDDVPKSLCHLEGKAFDNYINDMNITQDYATLNRLTMATRILDHLDLNAVDVFESVHNYIDENNILRKGAVSANLNEKIIIPMNMRDGSLLCLGKGNKEWNNSAPHGAGRLMSRTKAKELAKWMIS